MNKCLIQPYRIPICLQPKENLKPSVEVLACGKGVLTVCALSFGPFGHRFHPGQVQRDTPHSTVVIWAIFFQTERTIGIQLVRSSEVHDKVSSEKNG